MLMAAGVEVPRQVCVHGWVNFAGEELSQSGGHVVRPAEVVERFGSDALRYFLLREVAYERDGDFTWEGMARRYQHDLGNDLGQSGAAQHVHAAPLSGWGSARAYRT